MTWLVIMRALGCPPCLLKWLPFPYRILSAPWWSPKENYLSVVAVRTSLRSVRTATTSGQYSPVRPLRSFIKQLGISKQPSNTLNTFEQGFSAESGKYYDNFEVSAHPRVVALIYVGHGCSQPRKKKVVITNDEKFLMLRNMTKILAWYCLGSPF